MYINCGGYCIHSVWQGKVVVETGCTACGRPVICLPDSPKLRVNYQSIGSDLIVRSHIQATELDKMADTYNKDLHFTGLYIFVAIFVGEQQPTVYINSEKSKVRAGN